MEMTGAKLLVKALIMEKVDMIFAYPGGQIIDVFDALYEKKEIEVILPRHEQGLIHAADGYARSTKKVGVCLVTSGPGATNLVTGIATAQYDSVPLVCFTGQVPQNLQGKDAFQEVNIVEITKSICKLAISVNNREDLGGAIQKAFFIAKNGRPGVVVVDLPKDIQRALGSSSYMASQVKMFPKNHTDRSKLLLIKAMDIIHKSKRPLFLLGGGIGMSKASKEIVELIKTLEIPVVTTIMGKGAIPTRHPLYLGNLGIHGSVCANMAVSECDVLIAIGTRFNDRITGKTEKFKENKILIHIDIDPGSLSKNIQADIGILGDAKVVISEMQKQARHLFLPEWMEQINQWKQNYPMTMVSQEMTPLDIIQEINHYFKDVIVVTDVGQNQLWTTQFLELDENRQLLTSGGMGTMGFGFPAAIGAQLGNPDKTVLVITGDGGFQMNLQEMATATAYELPVIICIFNNGYLGNVRQWQELFFDKRYSSTCLLYRKSCNRICHECSKDCKKGLPDYQILAQSYEADSILVRKKEEIKAAFQKAERNKQGPTVIEFLIQREENVLPIVAPGTPLNQMLF